MTIFGLIQKIRINWASLQSYVERCAHNQSLLK